MRQFILLLLCMSWTAQGQRSKNATIGSSLVIPLKERSRRLIPYMTFYVAHQVPPGYRQQTKAQEWPYVPQAQPQFALPLAPPQYQRPSYGGRFSSPSSSSLTRLISNNYLSLAKHQGLPQRLSPRPEDPPRQPTTYQPNTDYDDLPYEPQYQFQYKPLPEVIYKTTPQPQTKPYLEVYSRDQDLTPVQFVSKPVHEYVPEKETVTITQSQEIHVETPKPKYHAKYNKVQIIDPVEDNGETDLNNILGGVSLSKALPERITPENLGSSIKALSKLLKILQRAHALPNAAKEIVTSFPSPIEHVYKPKYKKPYKDDEGGTPGRPGIDYPTYHVIPQTRFSCKDQRYKGFFGDPETGCQGWHYCDLNGGQASFLCPNGTIFSQVALTCDWWFNVKCSSTAQLYVLNERLYKYILPQKPSFPEDFAGPLVDRYLTQKFQEIEQNKTKDASKESSETAKPYSEDNLEPYSLDDVESENKVRSVLLSLP